MMSRFVNQVALVTGGARGIGFGVAQRLGREGAKIAIVDANPIPENENALRAQNIEAFSIKCDVTDQQQVRDAVNKIIERYQKVDVLVQAAGITGKTNLKTHEVELDDFERVMKVNVHGTFLFCKEVIPHMLKQNYGRIVNIASIAGKEGNAGMLAYSTSKAGVIGLTKVIGKEYAETKITCNCIVPAVIRTEMVAAMPEAQVKYMTDKIPMKRTGEMDEITALIAFVASPECSFSTAACYDASGGRATY